MRRLGMPEKSDERILGRGEFVEQFFDNERLHHVAKHVEKICKKKYVSFEALKSGNRRQKVPMVRSKSAKNSWKMGAFIN